MWFALLIACNGPATVATETDNPTVDTSDPQAEAACERYAAVVPGLTEGEWTGDLSTCDGGVAPPAGVENSIAMVNYARELAGVPALVEDVANRDAAQACAVMMHANDALSHSPDDGWACYDADGAASAATSLLAREPAVGAILQYMVDFGNETTLVHRRWLLNPDMPSIALGTTDEFSCLRLGSLSVDSAGWVAWPPPGHVPIEVLSERNSSVDAEGWSIQSDAFSLDSAEVTVVVDGEEHPQTVEVLTENQGSRYAIRFVPDGFESAPGRLTVRVDGIAEPFEYEVVLVGCEG